MASLSWIGGAPAIAQVSTWTFATGGTTGDVVTVAIGSKTWTYAVTSGAIATFLPLLAAALEALSSSIWPEFAEVAWTNTSTALIGASNTPGKTFIAAISTNSSTTTITPSATTPSSGPYDVSTPANYSNGLLPAGACIAPVQAAAVIASGGSLTDSTPYYWVVTATNANGETVVSNQQTLTPASTNQTAHLSWGAVANATGYKVYRSTTSNTYGSSSLVTTIGSGSTVTYSDTGSATTTGQPPGSTTAIGDTLYVTAVGAMLLSNLQALAGVVLASRQISSPNVVIGLPKTNIDGTAYPEYRQDYWQITATQDVLNTGSGRIKLDHGAGQTAFTQQASGQGAETGVPAVLVKGTNANNQWNFFGGFAGIAWFSTEAAHVNLGRVDSGASVVCGVNCVVDTFDNFGGTLSINGAVGTLLEHPGQGGGITYVNGSGAMAQLTMQSGTCYYNSTAALNGAVILANNSVLSLDMDQRPKTIANPISLYSSSAKFVDSYMVSGGYTLNFQNCAGSVAAPTNGTVTVGII